MKKIFVIGFNKCGTRSIHKLFKGCNINAVHDGTGIGALKLAGKYDAITDGEHLNFQDYYDKYPNSLFILNTRPLKKWLISRYTHHIPRIKNFKTYKSWCWPPSIEKTTEWIERRDKHYKNVKKFFRNKPKQLIIINIEEPGWETKVIKFIKKRKYIKKFQTKTIHRGETVNDVINKKLYNKMKKIVNKSLKKMNVNGNII